jgi:hypothetical protein
VYRTSTTPAGLDVFSTCVDNCAVMFFAALQGDFFIEEYDEPLHIFDR